MSPRCRLCGCPVPAPQPAHPGAVLCDRCEDCGEPALATVARRAGRGELVVVTHAPAVLERLRAAGAREREEGVLELGRAPC